MIERLAAIASVLDPMPAAVLEEACGLFGTAPTDPEPMWRTAPESIIWAELRAALIPPGGTMRVRSLRKISPPVGDLELESLEGLKLET